jgi:hypothetical protein
VDIPPPITRERFRVEPKEWDSAFFDRPIGALLWSGDARASDIDQLDQSALDELCGAADAAGYRLLECQVDLVDLAMGSRVESAGFRLVDSRIRFLTRWNRDVSDSFEPRWGRIRAATVEDRDRIIELTHLGLTLNPQFVSRFKNRQYFTESDTRRYFEAWIDSSAFADDAVTAVFETDDGVSGFYIYRVAGEHDGLPLVKGVLTAVAPEQRGAGAHRAMQSFLYGRLGLDEYWIDTVTQLSNTALIRSSLRSGKRYEQAALTFFRTHA